MNVLLYCGNGTNMPSVQAISQEIAECIPGAIFSWVTGENIRAIEDLTQKGQLLVFGGGDASQWDTDLQQDGVQKISQFIQKGGHFLGICAGAYFACEQSYFYINEQNYKHRQRELKLYPGWAVGPLYATENFLEPDAANAYMLDIGARVYYQAGPYFRPFETDNDCHVIAKYAEFNLDAIVSRVIGASRVVLCGPHIEFSWSEPQDNNHPTINALSAALYPYEAMRKELWKRIVSQLLS